ncbi:hypothetical protein GGR39_003421 [Novosphingobium fluoreni]|uniref:Uncharacterized protein n=1 Tax=Novosphingobium fluoreni TaxID=1391222 RepID=A0A7W6C711_9SPHN|nr:hypothetical protein [Novosphingobium fluoreni]
MYIEGYISIAEAQTGFNASAAPIGRSYIALSSLRSVSEDLKLRSFR